MAVAISHSGLAAYNQQEVEKYFLSPLFLGQDYLNKFTLYPSVKGSMLLDHFAAAEKITVAQTGVAFAGTAGAALTNITLSVGNVEAEMEERAITFVGVVKSEALKLGTERENVDGTVIKEIVSNMMMQAVKRDFNRQLWFGDTGATGTGNANYTPYNGIFVALQGLDAAQKLELDVTGASASAGCEIGTTGKITGAEAISVLDAMYDAATAELKELPKTFFVSGNFADAYMKYLRAQGISESFNYLQDGTPNISWNGIPIVVRRDWDSILATDYALIDGASAADSVIRAVLVADKAIAVGTDFEGAGFESWYSQDNKAYRFRLGYKVGCALMDKKLAVTAMHA